jgi:hypothetical protein
LIHFEKWKKQISCEELMVHTPPYSIFAYTAKYYPL